MIETRLENGLICAFDLHDASPRGDETLDDGPRERPVWLHFNLAHARARAWLRQREGLPDAAREVLLDEDSRIRVEMLPDGLVAVLGDIDHDFSGATEGFGVMRIYVGTDEMVSGRRHPLKAVDNLRRELQAGEVSGKSPIGLFEHYVECLAHTLAEVVNRLGDEVDDAEEEVLAGRHKQQGKSLGRIRRMLARLRRHVTANRAALAPVPARLPAVYTHEQRQSLRQAVEQLDAVGQDVELVQERARLIQEEIATHLNEATNRNLYILSIVTTALLPITLITGIFGMNVGGVPWSASGNGFFRALLLMGAGVVLVLWLLRRQRVL
jgi:zinc transporter